MAAMVATQLLLFGLPCSVVLLVRQTEEDPAWHMDWREIVPLRWPGFRNLLMIALLMLLAEPVMMLLSALSALVANNNIGEIVDEIAVTQGFWATLLVVAVMPSIMEELMFRGVILSGYKNKPVWIMVLVNGLFFGIMHTDLQQFLYAVVMGCLAAYMVHKTRSFFAGVLAHFMVNATSVVMMFVTPETEAVTAAEIDAMVGFEKELYLWTEANPELAAAIMMGVISLVTIPLFCVLFMVFKRHNEKRNAKADAKALAQAADIDAEGASAIGIIGTADAEIEVVDDSGADKSRPFGAAFWGVVALYAVIMGLIWVGTNMAAA